MFQTGDKIGSYILKAQIGRGAFGVVWLAEETTSLTSHRVALKLPSESSVNLESIRQEAFLWEQVKGHPNILPIIKADIVNNQIFIASEYAPDGALSGWMRKHGGKAPNAAAAVEMTRGILAGLAHLHSRTVIHRDLKPENILLQGDTPRIADFGIARVLKDTDSFQTAGTPSYMAPEGFNGVRSEQTDIWAVGVIFYQLLTGLLPYPQTDLLSIVKAAVYEEPQINYAAIPEPLRVIVCRALEKDILKRYQKASGMLADLKKVNLSGFEDHFNAETVPDIPSPTGESIIDRSPTDQNAPTVKVTWPIGDVRTTDRENHGTNEGRNAPATLVLPKKKRRFLSVGLGLLVGVILFGTVALLGLNWYKNSSNDQQNSNSAALSNSSTNEKALYNRSLWAEWALMLENDDYEKIIRETTAELERRPDNIVAYRMRATAFYNLEQEEPARMDVREVLRLSTEPKTAEEFEARCYALKVINKPDEALENCTKAIEADPQMALAYNIRGTVYHQKKLYELAVAEYDRAIELSPRKTFFENRALAYRALGNKNLALKDEKEAVALSKFNSANRQMKNESKHPDSIKSAPSPTKTPQPRPTPESRKTPSPKIMPMPTPPPFKNP